ncbi:MAG TPA: hypothetical protein VGN44_06465 [Candidatus Angelobacter sp.]|jgi:hypothetical protein
MTKSKATDPPQYGYLGPNTDFGHFLQLVEAIQGTAIITVNYGSNLAGTGGGEPAEAAAWVAYANGSPADQKVIGKDSTGYDWKTVGYWASLRASKPLEADDGQNFLRIAHLMQDGAANIDWLELHKPSFLDDSNKPGPVFFALQMISSAGADQ